MGFPLTSKTNEDGVRVFINGMGNGIIYIDKVGLEEMIEYHSIFWNYWWLLIWSREK